MGLFMVGKEVATPAPAPGDKAPAVSAHYKAPAVSAH